MNAHIVLALVISSTPIAPEHDGWHAIGPVPRRDHAMAYDSARGVMVMFGGLQLKWFDPADAFLGDTWELKSEPDSVWEQRCTAAPLPNSVQSSEGEQPCKTAPSPRYAHSMVYDSVRKVIVLSGGVTGEGAGNYFYSGETWEYDGTVWTLRSIQGPSPRAGFAFAFDSARGVAVLHGGHDGAPNGETWEYDGNNWQQQRTFGGPAARSSHAMAFDSERNVCVMYGGVIAPGLFIDETWEYDGSSGTWSNHTVASDLPSFRHTLTFDPVHKVTLRWGGDPFSGLHAWNGQNWTPVNVAGAQSVSNRKSHACAYDNARQRIVMFGGYMDNDGSVWNDTWEIVETNGTLQAIERNPAPHAGALQLMFYDSQRHVINLHFGDVMWEWDGSSQTWALRQTSGPGPRTNTSIVYDSKRHVAVLFGGFAFKTGLLDDTWEWNGQNGTWTLKSTTGPSPRRDHAMAFDAARGVTVLFGGAPGGQSASDETWEWDGTNWTQRNLAAAPPSRWGHAMVFDAHRNVTVLHGGRHGTNGNTLYSDTWVFDGNQWMLGSNNGPSPSRYGFAMTYDSVHRQTILFGGYAPSLPYGYVNQVWTWDGTEWTFRALLNGPEPRYNSAMAFDSDQQNTVIVGGFGWIGAQRDQWLLRLPATCAGDVAPSYGDGTINVSDLLSVINNWGAAKNGSGDANHDGVVNVADLLMVVNNWGTCD
jgi:hypothetical protein